MNHLEVQTTLTFIMMNKSNTVNITDDDRDVNNNSI